MSLDSPTAPPSSERAAPDPGPGGGPGTGPGLDLDLDPASASAPAVASDAARASAGVDVLVGIPAYNAAGTVGAVVRAAAVHADAVVVVDDGSVDGTGDRAREAGATVVTHPANGGYGAALKSIFREAAAREARLLVIVDADGQHDAADIPRLLAPLSGPTPAADVVIGSRFADGGATDAPLYRRAGLAVVNGLTNASLGTTRRGRIRDTQSGFRAYTADAVATLATDVTIGDRMSASLDVLYHVVRAGYRVVEVGTTITYDVEDASSENPIVHGVELVANVVRRTISDRPFASVAVAAAAALVVTRAVVRPGRR